MWWFLKKEIDNAEEVVYTYGFETKEQTGKIKFNRKSEDFEIVQIAKNDSVILIEKFLLRHLFRLIFVENAPNEKQIAIA